MPRHDYYCGVCGQVLVDVYRSVHEGAQATPPLHCARPMAWLPQTTAMDVGGVKGASFQAFTTTDGRGQRVTIDSLRKLRQVERESEVAYRNGEGQPMVFRRWAQNESNRDQPTLSPSYNPATTPTPAAKRRFGRQGALSVSSSEPDASYGPGVTDANTSALPTDR